MDPNNSMEFTSANVEMAVRQFYLEPSNERLNTWLTSAQSSKEAWKFCWDLINLDKPTEVQYFGANTLHLKISKFWDEIPDDYIGQLRVGLLHLLETHAKNTRPVVIKICVSLGCYMLQTIPHLWPNALEDLVSSVTLSSENDSNTKSICQKNMLEILTVIPEEYPNLHLSHTRKSTIGNELLKNSNSVLQLIYHLLTATWPTEVVKTQAIKCLSSWLQIGISIVQQEHESLVFLLFDLLKNPAYFIDTAEAIVFVFKGPSNHKYPRTVIKYLRKVAELGPFFDAEVNDSDVTQSLTKIFVSAAENSISLILSTILCSSEDSQTSLGLLELIIKTITLKAQYPLEEQCSDLAFGFLYNLQDEVSQKDQPQHLVELFKKMYTQLFADMTFKIKYPSDDDYKTWSPDDKESFRCYRQDFADAAAYFSSFLGGASMTILSELLAVKLTVLRDTQSSVDWQEFECIIYMMTAVMEGFNVSELISVGSIFAFLPYIPCNNNTLITQIMFFIASCADLMEECVVLFSASVPFLLKGLSDKELSSASSMSLKDVLSSNRIHIRLVSKDILQALKNAFECQSLESSDYVRLANCLGYILSDLTPNDALEVVNVILSPHINIIYELASHDQLTPTTRTTLLDKLKILSGLFSSFCPPDGEEAELSSSFKSPNQCIVVMVGQLLPLIKLILQSCVNDESTMNELFDMVRRVVRSLSKEFSPFIVEFCQLITAAYNENPLSCMLEAAKSLMILFSNDQQFHFVLQNLFTMLCNKSLQHIETSPRNFPDVIEAFMAFLSQICKKNPALLKNESCHVFGLFSAAMIGIVMNEHSTSKASCQFMSSLILTTDMTQIIQLHGTRLVEMLVLAIAGTIPRYNISPLADVFVALATKYFDILARTLSEIMSRENFPNPKATPASKQQFVKAVLMAQKNKRKLKEAISEYALLWRGLLNSEYGTQTAGLAS